MKRGITGPMIAVIVVAALLVAGSVMYIAVQSISGGDGIFGDGDDQDITITGKVPYGKIYFEVDAGNRHQSAQDDQDDYNHDIYETKGSCLDDLKDEYYVDCSGASAHVWDGKKASFEVPDSAICEVNPYKFWQVFTNGDTETSFQADTSCKLVGTGSMGDVDADDQGTWSAGNANYSVTLEPDKQYIISTTDDSEDDDVYPVVWLLKTPEEVDKSYEDKVDTVNLILRANVDVNAEAFANSRVDFGGECRDSVAGGFSTTLAVSTTAFAGMIHQSHTTAQSNVNYDCDITMKVNRDGYGMYFNNPLAESDQERSYMKIDPYGEWVNATPLYSNFWVELQGTTNATYNVAPAATGDYTQWSFLTVAGASITTDSTIDSMDMALERLRVDDLNAGNFLGRDYIGEDAEATFEIAITNINSIDYDAAVIGNNSQLDAASGSSPESVCDINLITLLDGTDRIARLLSA